MITQDYLNSEIDLARKIFLYYTDKIISYSNIGSDKYISWYIDSLELYFLVKHLENINISSDLYYIGSTEIDEDSIKLVFSKVREYYKSDIDVDYEFSQIPIPIIPTYKQLYVADWKEFKVTVADDNTTVITLPVNLPNIADMESIQCTINGISDPDYNIDTNLDGYHIEGTTFYWHTSNFYNLMAGTTIRIQYLQIVG